MLFAAYVLIEPRLVVGVLVFVDDSTDKIELCTAQTHTYTQPNEKLLHVRKFYTLNPNVGEYETSYGLRLASQS